MSRSLKIIVYICVAIFWPYYANAQNFPGRPPEMTESQKKCLDEHRPNSSGERPDPSQMQELMKSCGIHPPGEERDEGGPREDKPKKATKSGKAPDKDTEADVCLTCGSGEGSLVKVKKNVSDLKKNIQPKDSKEIAEKADKNKNPDLLAQKKQIARLKQSALQKIRSMRCPSRPDKDEAYDLEKIFGQEMARDGEKMSIETLDQKGELSLALDEKREMCEKRTVRGEPDKFKEGHGPNQMDNRQAGITDNNLTMLLLALLSRMQMNTTMNGMNGGMPSMYGGNLSNFGNQSNWMGGGMSGWTGQSGMTMSPFGYNNMGYNSLGYGNIGYGNMGYGYGSGLNLNAGSSMGSITGGLIANNQFNYSILPYSSAYNSYLRGPLQPRPFMGQRPLSSQLQNR